MRERKIESLEVWRAAQRVIERHPDESEFAACQLADAALDKGDMFGFELWQKVAVAVGRLSQSDKDDPI